MSFFTGLDTTRRLVLRQPARWTLPGFASAAALVGWSGFLRYGEPEASLFYAVVSIFLACACLIFALAGRPRFALAFAAFLFVCIFVAARAKFALVAMTLHVYDIAFYGSSSAPLEFFLSAYPRLATILGLGLATGALALALLWRQDATRSLSGRQRGLALVCAGGFAALGAWPLSGRNADFFNDTSFALSSFFSSFGDLPQLYSYRGLIEVAPDPSIKPAPASAITCRPGTTPPDIVMFLNESAMPPGVYPDLAYPDELKPFFASADGRIHPLRVETFGGGTWLSDFSALTGLSTRAFGNLRNFVANFMTGRLRHSLPQYLKACGYETSIVYPASAGFAGVGRFYKAIGFDRVIDTSVHHAPDQRQRDAFYLGEVARVIEGAGRGKAHKPQFIVAASMSTHSPWDFRFAPEQVVAGETLRWNADPEFDEYLWRLVLARRDRDAFRARLAKNMPDQRILYVSYGDHQPALAKVPLDNNRAIADEGRSWQLDPTSKAFETSFSVDAQGFTPVLHGADLPIVEIAHLPIITVIAAGLPLDNVFERRAWLMDRCHGLYATCADRTAVLAFQRWLVDSRWIAQN